MVQGMKIFLSAMENATSPKSTGGKQIAELLVEKGIELKYILMSYFYIGKNTTKMKLAEFIRDNSQEIMIDSGAHSFQKGKVVKWEEYTRQYAEWITTFDRPHVVGYFEMDVDNVIGYQKVLELRKILDAVSDKIIPVWHKNRGIEEYKKMCRDYSGKIVAITGFKNEDIQDHQYMMFLKYAKEHNCQLHCLGMTRKKVLDKVPFDYTDSSSWVQQTVFGRVEGRGQVSRKFSKERRDIVFIENYVQGLAMQNKYYKKWRNVHK